MRADSFFAEKFGSRTRARDALHVGTFSAGNRQRARAPAQEYRVYCIFAEGGVPSFRGRVFAKI